MSEPQAAIDAMLCPQGLTLGQVAILEKIKSPLLSGASQEAFDLIPSLYLLALPVQEACKKVATDFQGEAMAWADSLQPAAYQAFLKSVMEGLVAFYQMLPGAEGEASKKASPAMAGSSRSRNGQRGRITGRSE